MINPPPHSYSAVGYERCAERRRDEVWLRQRLSDPSSLVVLLDGLEVLVEPGGAAPLLALAETGRHDEDEPLFLGTVEGRAVFALQRNGRVVEAGAARFVELRRAGALLPAREAGLLAYARALMHWHQRNRYCGACGGTTAVIEGGHARRCPGCDLVVFPRTDPAVIVLVTSGEQCVLARSAHFRPGMYSTVAGFVEPGEGLEQTIRREVFEEIGIRISDARYRSSQPWPFPQSLMLGFRAEVPWQPVRIDEDEIEDARWFHADELRDPQHRPILLPTADSIARFLVEEWLSEARQ